MRKLIDKFLCFIGFHIIDETEWRDVYGWGTRSKSHSR